MNDYSQRMTTIPLVRRRQLPIWVTVIILLCCLVELAILLLPILGYPQGRSLAFFLGGFWSPLVWAGGRGLYPGQAILMFVTYGLLHSGLMHLVMNMISLAVIGRELNRMVGSRRMAWIYVFSQLGAALAFVALEPDAGPMVGASGAIFGLAGALVGFAAVTGYRKRREMGQMWRSVILLLILNIALTVLMPQIAWQAHLGGAIVGLVMGVYMALGTPQRR